MDIEIKTLQTEQVRSSARVSIVTYIQETVK